MPLRAAVITYEEVIRDTKDPLVFFDFRRDLERSRSLGDGSSPLVELDDAVIEAQNLVSDSFGRWGREPIAYSHVFQAVAPVESFLLASLKISAASVSGTPDNPLIPDFFELLLGLGTPDDMVVVDGIFVGYLNPANPFAEVTVEFSTGDAAVLGVLLADNRLDVTIIPMGPGFIGEPPVEPEEPGEPNGDKIAVRSSTLSVTYTVPEPASVTLLLAAGVAALFARKRSTSRRA